MNLFCYFADDDFKPGPSKPLKKSEDTKREVLKEVDPKDYFGKTTVKAKPEKGMVD